MSKMNGNKVIFLFLTIFLSGFSFANNLIINNVSRPANDKIRFDISWENSWYANAAPNNWDAVWVFIKAQDCNTNEKAWLHVDINTNSGTHSTSNPLQVDATADGKGVFIRRSAPGMGNISTTSVELQLQNTYNLSNVNFEVFGIEMVAVLQGDFEVGNGENYAHSFAKTTINSENAIAQGTLYNSSTNNSNNPAIGADFPKGYDQFYIMKYEITQEQYVRFLNLLNYPQQLARTSYDPASSAGTTALVPGQTSGIHNRNGIKITSSANSNGPAVYNIDLNDNANYNEGDDGQNLACNYLSWQDLLAYLDWAALRPMTELEYEKACRGLTPSVKNEYAWRTTNLTATNSGALTDAGMGSEVSTTNINPNTGLAAVGASNSTYGPLRVGFAARNSPSRAYAGASYWGVLDLTGNVWEQTVSAGYDLGNISNFAGGLGDGEIDGSGNADEADWDLNPLYSVVRGGSWFTGGGGEGYCTSILGSVHSSYRISQFQLAGLNNSSANTGSIYSDYTSTVAPAILTAGQSVTATITFPSTAYYRNVSIWIDYNNNGIFEPSERVATAYYGSTYSSSTSLSASFTPPNVSGVFRLRVAYRYSSSSSSAISDPCDITTASSYGEVEDYLVIIGNGPGTPVSFRYNVDNENLNQNRHGETGGRGVRQF